MDIIKTSDFFFFFFFVRKEGVWVTALGGLALHVCTSFITNRHNMVRTQTYPDKAQTTVYIVCPDIKGKEMKTAMSLVSWVAPWLFRHGATGYSEQPVSQCPLHFITDFRNFSGSLHLSISQFHADLYLNIEPKPPDLKKAYMYVHKVAIRFFLFCVHLFSSKNPRQNL